MTSFESMTEEDKLQYAHALERKGRELIELILRKRRVTEELRPLLSPADQDIVIGKIHSGIDERIVIVQAEVIAAEPQPKVDPDAPAPVVDPI